MGKETTYAAAKTLLEEGWKADRITIVVADGGKRQGWKWTDPTGATSEVVGRWCRGAAKPRRVTLPPTWHMKIKEISPRNRVFLVGTIPVPCEGCGEAFPERSFVPGPAGRRCLGCVLVRKVAVEREAYRRDTFAGRARAYMEQLAAGRINCPDMVP